MKHLQDKVYSGQPFMMHLLFENVNKLQNIMMKLNIKIHYSITLEEKLVAFHHYAIMNDLSAAHFSSSDAREYFIRDICYVLIRIIKNNSEFDELRKNAIVYSKECLGHLIMFPEIMKKHFTPIVSTLINIIIEENNSLTSVSFDLLKYLFHDHIEIFQEVIKSMDNLPEHHLLLELSEIQSKLKKVDNEVSLKKEIQNFIDNGYTNKDCSSKIDTLKNLKLYLFSQKKQLKNLYKDLNKLNGFSEDCENSLVHQLVSLLVDLCHSKDKNVSENLFIIALVELFCTFQVSMEALKCLGELGPSDLMTLIVKPEKNFSFESSTPQEFFTGQVISLLYMYLIDDNIQLLSPSIDVLSNALNTTEGRKALGKLKSAVEIEIQYFFSLESGTDYGYGLLSKEYLIPFFTEKKPKFFSTSLKKNMELLISQINLNHLWCPNEPVEYDEWLKNLLCNILQTVSDCYIFQLIPICKLKVGNKLQYEIFACL